MVNPLLIPIQLEKVQLLCTHQTREEGGEPGEREGRVVEGEGGVVELRREEDHLDAQLPIADKGTVFTETFDIFLRAGTTPPSFFLFSLSLPCLHPYFINIFIIIIIVIIMIIYFFKILKRK